jgi:hypothetical protein
MLTDCETPTYDALRNHRLSCLLGIEAAERCKVAITTIYTGVELERLTEGYTRRADYFRLALATVEAQIAALPKHDIYPTEAQTAFRTLVLARRAGQVTPREFGLAAWWIRMGR